MARKKSPPQKAPEYKTTKKGNARKGKPVGSRLAFDDTKQEADKKKKAPGRAKDGSKCYTRVNKVGGKYITCEGTQGKGKAKSPAPAAAPKKKTSTKSPAVGGSPPKGTKVKVGTLNPGKVIKDAPKASGADRDKEALKKIGITRDVKEDEVRFKAGTGGQEAKYISSKDEKVFIRRIQKLAGWTTDYAPLSAGQRKKLLSFRGRNDIFLSADVGLGSNAKTRAIDVIQIDKRDSKGRVRMTTLPKIRFKFIGKV